MELAAEVVESTSEDALVQNRAELKSLGQGAQLEVTEFTKAVAQALMVSPEFLATAVAGDQSGKVQEWGCAPS